MTLLAYFELIRIVATSTSALKNASTCAESSEEIELLTSRLETACDALTNASCKDAGRSDLREAKRLIREARRVVLG